MSYGIEMKNEQGMVILDSEHPLPKLYHQGTISLTSRGTDPENRAISYGVLQFPPTPYPVFATVAINETATPNGKLRFIRVERDAQGRFYGIYVAGDPNFSTQVVVWVYEL